MIIKIYFQSCDGCRRVKNFKSLRGARKAAQDYVGAHPEMGRDYAISGDGIGKVQVVGATLADIFPDAQPRYTEPAKYGL
jgi:hypothetical protein